MYVLRFVLLFLLLLLPAGLNAQWLAISEIDRSAFPTLSATFSAAGATGGEPLNGLTVGDLRLTENGVVRPIRGIMCEDKGEEEGISSVLMIDVSGSMSGTNLGYARSAAEAWIEALPPLSECAIASFSDNNLINRDFTSDRPALLASLSTLTTSGGTNYNAAFIDPVAGGILVAREGRYRRVLIFLSDGQPNFMPQTERIIAEALKYNITIYTVTLGMPTTELLDNIAHQTGGESFGSVTTEEEARDVYRQIMVLAGVTPRICRIEWESSLECDTSRMVELSIPSKGLSASFQFTLPATTRVRGAISPRGNIMRDVVPGTPRDTSFFVRAVSGDLEVQGISVSDPRFTVVSPIPPFTVPAGDSQRVVVRFLPTDDNYAIGEYTVSWNACDRETRFVIVSGNIAPGEKLPPTVRIVTPNGGEAFLAGSDTTITWGGVLPDEPVRLEYSIDNGLTWNRIADSAVGLSYPWRVPPTPSSLCLARAAQYGDPSAGGEDLLILSRTFANNEELVAGRFSPEGARVVGAEANGKIKVWASETARELLTIPAGNVTANTCSFSPDGEKILSGDDVGRVRVWDAYSGELLKEIYDPLFTGVVTAAEYSPDGSLIAVGGPHVRIFNAADYTTASELKADPLLGAVVKLAFSPDGKYLAAGYQNSATFEATVLVWDLAAGSIVHTLVPKGKYMFDLRYSRDGSMIASSHVERVHVWRASNGGQMYEIVNRDFDRINAVSFDATGGKLLVGGEKTPVTEYDMTTGAEVKRYTAMQPGLIRFLQHQPGSSRVLIGGYTLDRLVAAVILDPNVSVRRPDTSDAVWSIVKPQGATVDVDMGTVPFGNGRDSVVVDFLSNNGTWPLAVDSIRITGGSGSFSVSPGAVPEPVVPGKGAPVKFRFQPTAPGSFSATIEVFVPGDTLRSRIFGTATTPRIAVLAKLVDFGIVPVGSSRDTLNVLLLSNPGTTPLTITGTAMRGPDISQFEITTGGGSFTIPAKGTHLMSLRFSPVAAGRTSGSIAFEFAGEGSPAVAELFGEGVRPEIAAIGAPEIVMLCQDYRDTMIRAANPGLSKLVITEGSFSGADSAEFSFPGSQFPVTIYSGDTGVIVVRMRSTTFGPKSTRLVLTSNAMNAAEGRTEIPLTGAAGTTGMAISRSDIDFGTVVPGEEPTETLTLTNTGTVPLTWNVPITIGPFVIDAVVPSVTGPGESSMVTIRFAGAEAGERPDTLHLLADPGCGRTVELRLRGRREGDPAAATLTAPEVSAAPGEIVRIPIILRNLPLLMKAGVTEVTAVLRFDASLLLPVAPTPIGVVEGGERLVPLTFRPAAGADTIEMLLPFRAALGRDTTTALTFEKSAMVGGNAMLLEIPGRFLLEGVCRDGDPRLFSREGTALLKGSRPNPIGGPGTIEYDLIENGRTLLLLTDALGGTVRTLAEGNASPGSYAVEFDASDLPAGVYFIVLETETRRSVQAIRVER